MKRYFSLGMFALAILLSIPPPQMLDGESKVHTNEDSHQITIVVIKKRKGDLKC